MLLVGVLGLVGYERSQDDRRRAEQLTEKFAAEQREYAARQCIADDVARMEFVVSRTKYVGADNTIGEAKDILDAVLGTEGSIVIPKDALKDLTLVYTVPTKCDSKFRFLINVRARRVDQDGPVAHRVAWLKVWAENAPAGYNAPAFDKDFDEIRLLAAKSAALAAAQQRLEATSAAQSARVRQVEAEREAVAAKAEAARKATAEAEEARKAALLAEAANWNFGPCEPGISREQRLALMSLDGQLLQMDANTWFSRSFKLQIGRDGAVYSCGPRPRP